MLQHPVPLAPRGPPLLDGRKTRKAKNRLHYSDFKRTSASSIIGSYIPTTYVQRMRICPRETWTWHQIRNCSASISFSLSLSLSLFFYFASPSVSLISARASREREKRSSGCYAKGKKGKITGSSLAERKKPLRPAGNWQLCNKWLANRNDWDWHECPPFSLICLFSFHFLSHSILILLPCTTLPRRIM